MFAHVMHYPEPGAFPEYGYNPQRRTTHVRILILGRRLDLTRNIVSFLGD